MAFEWEPPPDPDLSALFGTAVAAWSQDQPKVIAWDTETTGLTWADRPFCVTLAWHSDDPIQGPGVYGYYVELSEHGAPEFVRAVLNHAERHALHNGKFDLRMLENAGVWTPDQWGGTYFDDTEALAHLDDEHRPKKLKKLAVSVLGESDIVQVPKRRHLVIDGEKQYDEKGKKVMEPYLDPQPREDYEVGMAKEWAKRKYGLASVDDVGYDLLPRGTIVPYAIKDAVFTLRLAGALYPRIVRDPELFALYEREVFNTTRGAAMQMERAGMAVRTDYLAEQVKAYRKKCYAHELAIERMVGKPVRTGKIAPKERADYFNPGSSSPDAANFLAAAGFERGSYDAENLRGINHPLADLLLVYRKDVKLLDGYLVALAKETGEDGIFHPSLRYHGTVSGRTSAGAERGDG